MKKISTKKKAGIKHHPTKASKQTPVETKVDVCLRSGGVWVAGHCKGGHCEICLDKKRDGRGLKYMHKKRRQMGGTNNPEIHSPENVFRSCYVCDEENDGERLPKNGPVDKPFQLSGFHHGQPYSVEQQCGIKRKEVRIE